MSLDHPTPLWHGTRAASAGVYDVPMLWYHDDCCIDPSISSGGLRTLLARTPRAYWHTSPLNPDRAPMPEPTAAMRLGAAAHALLLEPHTFRRLYEPRPDSFDSWRTKAAREYRAARAMEGITVLEPSEMERIIGIAAALRDHDLRDLLAGHVERSLIWPDEATGVWLKSRPDAIPTSANIYADLKCMAGVTPDALRRAIFDRGYHVQMALADMGMEFILGRKMEEYVVVAVDSDPPHDVIVAPIDPEAIGWGRKLVRKALGIFARCLEDGRWPSYEAQEGLYIHVPDWLRGRYNEDPDLK